MIECVVLASENIFIQHSYKVNTVVELNETQDGGAHVQLQYHYRDQLLASHKPLTTRTVGPQKCITLKDELS